MTDIKSGYGKSQWDNISLGTLFDSQAKGDFYHYTSFSSAIKMLTMKDDYFTLYASHFLYLNDSEEFTQGLSLLKKRLNMLSKKVDLEKAIRDVCKSYYYLFSRDSKITSYVYPHHFIISFCSEGNSLNQWKYYGRDCGIAIEYDLNNSLFDGFCTWDRDQLGSHPIFNVIYDDVEKNKILDQILATLEEIKTDYEYLSENIIMRACAAVSYMKSQHFESEKEARLLFAPIFNDSIPSVDDNNPMRLIHYREAGGKIKPYLEIKVKQGKAFPIRSVTVGPGHNQTQIFNAMVMLIRSNTHGFTTFSSKDDYKLQVDKNGCKYTTVNNIKIRMSSIPFRD